MVDPAISLSVATPQIANPVDQFSKAIALKDLVSQVGLRNQQIQQSQQATQNLQAEAQQKQRDVNDQKLTQQTILAHKDDGDQMWPNTLKELEGQVSPVFLNNLQKAHNETVTAGLNMNDAQIANSSKVLDKVDNVMTGLKSLDPNQVTTEYPNALARLSNDPDVGSKVQALIANGTIPQHWDPDAIDRIHATVVGQKGLLAEEASRQTAAQEAATAAQRNQEAENLGAQLPGVQADAAQKVSHLPVAKALDAAQLQDPSLLTQEQRTQQQNAEKIQQTNAGRLSVEQGRLALEKAKQNAEIGPETAQSWVDVLKRNPDAEKEIPAPIRSKVSTLFQQQTGLPMPSGAPATSQTTELAARNALDNAAFIQKAIQNPEIQKRLGPVLGRLGQFEQNLGTATAGLSPAAAQLAQELRTRMRYFVFQEGKSVLGGRLPQNLMKQLEESSADVHMDAPTLSGSLDGATGAALTNMDNVDKERFGGQARPRVLRGLPPGEVRPNPSGTGRIASDDGGKTVYDPDTGAIIPK